MKDTSVKRVDFSGMKFNPQDVAKSVRAVYASAGKRWIPPSQAQWLALTALASAKQTKRSKSKK